MHGKETSILYPQSSHYLFAFFPLSIYLYAEEDMVIRACDHCHLSQ